MALCLLFVAWWCVGCCLSVDGCLWFVVCRVLFVAGCMLLSVRWLLSVVCSFLLLRVD